MIKDYQKRIDDCLQKYKEPYWPPLSQFARMAEEVGEIGRILNHEFGSKPKKPDEADQDLGEEIADVVFNAICLANSQGIDLDEKMEQVINKLQTRDAERFKKK